VIIINRLRSGRNVRLLRLLCDKEKKKEKKGEVKGEEE
jgi:hypothetical protein